MDKLLDILTRLEHLVNIEDGAWRKWMLSLIHQAMDIVTKGKAHKWPEEKPEHGKEYIVYSKDEECGCSSYLVAEWKDYLTPDECVGPYGLIWNTNESGWYIYNDSLYLIAVDGVTHYWELPEVKE